MAKRAMFELPHVSTFAKTLRKHPVTAHLGETGEGRAVLDIIMPTTRKNQTAPQRRAISVEHEYLGKTEATRAAFDAGKRAGWKVVVVDSVTGVARTTRP